MTWQSGGGAGPWGGGGRKPTPELEDLIRQGQDRLKQFMPGGGLRGIIPLAVLVLIGIGDPESTLRAGAGRWRFLPDLYAHLAMPAIAPGPFAWSPP
jgi:hypothetical protein